MQGQQRGLRCKLSTATALLVVLCCCCLVTTTLAMPAFGNYTALFVLVQFPDHVQDRTVPSKSYFQSLCETRVADYMAKQSYGQYYIECSVQEWKVTDNNETFYAAGVANRKNPEDAAGFAVAVLDELDIEFNGDWSKYDVDEDGALDAVMLLHSGWASERSYDPSCPGGLEPLQRLQSMAGPSSNGAWRSKLNDKYWLSGYGIASAFDTTCSNTPALMGVITHEFSTLLSMILSLLSHTFV